MENRRKPKTESDHVAWGKDKLARMDDRTFVMPEYGPRILDVLLGCSESLMWLRPC